MTLGEPIRIWDLATGKKVAEFNGEDPVFSPDGRTVASVNPSRNETVARVWEARTGKSLAATQAGKTVVRSVAFSPDGSWLITVSDDRVGVWEAATARSLRQLNTSSSSKIVSVRFAPDAHWLALTFDSDIGKRDRLYPRERFAPLDVVVGFAGTLVARKLNSYEAYRYGIDQD